jgi:hypothetical protein
MSMMTISAEELSDLRKLVRGLNEDAPPGMRYSILWGPTGASIGLVPDRKDEDNV